MENKHYVIQMKIGERGEWKTIDHEYPTLVDARTAMDRKQKEGRCIGNGICGVVDAAQGPCDSCPTIPAASRSTVPSWTYRPMVHIGL